MLGSIAELPAETCKEIKASDEGQAVSGEYWFDSIIPGQTVLAHCDMKKEGKLKRKGEVRNLKTSLKLDRLVSNAAKVKGYNFNTNKPHRLDIFLWIGC